MLLTYTNVIDELSRFVQKNHLSVYSPYAIMTAARVLYSEVKARIESVFRAPVFNRYGSKEVSIIACNCEKDEGLHMIPAVHYL